MTHKVNWLEKQFDFDFPVERYVELRQALGETHEKLQAMVGSLPRDTLIRQDGDSWSIQENVGHFLTLESLFHGRLDDFLNNASVLRPANFEDNQTDKVHYNEKEIAWILSEFRRQRGKFILRLEALQPEDFGRIALHPRLNKTMRLCDSMFFEVEHDRHHLLRIEELKEVWNLISCI
jgi:uncharacterized damage-inducible protein DinB